MAEILHYVGIIISLLLAISFKLTAVLYFNEFNNDYMAHVTIMINIPDVQGLPSVRLHVRSRLSQEEIL